MSEAKGWSGSSAAWIDFVERDHNRTALIDPVVLELAGDVEGKSVVDVGCGEGRFCRLLGERGAECTGIDPTREFIAQAKSRDKVGTYLVASGEHVPLASERFDIAVSYLTMIDIPDFRAAIRETARILRPGGILLYANLLSFRTALFTSWIKDAEGKRLYVAVDRYFEETAHHANWQDISVVNWHRPAESYFTALLGAGFNLEAYREPRSSLQDVAERPKCDTERRVPLFHVMRWRKAI